MISVRTADNALRDYYLDAITKELSENISPFYRAIEKSSTEVYGKDVKFSLLTGYAGSVSAADEESKLPVPFNNRYMQLTAPLKNIYGTIEISDKALRATREDSGAFVDLLNAEMQGLVKSAKASFSRMLMGDGNGYLFTITGKVSEYVYTVDTVKPYMQGMTVDVRKFTNLNMFEEKDVVIEVVDVSNGTVQLDMELNMENEENFKAKVFVAGVFGKEITGLESIFSGTTLYGAVKADEPYLNPITVSVNGALTENDLISAIDDIEETYGVKPDMILVSYATRKAIGNLIADNRRIVNSADLAVGYGEITVAGIPVYADMYCAPNTVYIVNSQDFRLCQLCDWEWLEDEDGSILKQIAGKAAYSATLVKYAELICTKPCAQCKITFGS